ncbi:MAG: hypothetical protein ACI9R3_003682 [Verrucomicrobiales bacterium]|jgi:hypothetical protein
MIVTLLSAQGLHAQVKQKVSATLPVIPPKGLVVYKLHKQADDFAPCVEYANIKMFPLVANMTTMGSRYLSVQRGQIAYHIIYPPANEELLTDADIDRLRKRITEYQAAGKRFKYAAPLLAPWIARFHNELEMLEQGLGRADGNWVQRSAFVYQREMSRLRSKSAARQGQTTEKTPLWTWAMEAQLQAERAASLKAAKERMKAKKLARIEKFQRAADPTLTRKTESKLTPGKLGAAESLENQVTLDKGKGLNR